LPLYEYKCSACGHRAELLQKVDSPPPKCSRCPARMSKLISRSSFILTGSGWYKDGYSSPPSGSEE